MENSINWVAFELTALLVIVELEIVISAGVSGKFINVISEISKDSSKLTLSGKRSEN